VLLVASGVRAEERLHRIMQFGTLNTIAGDFAMKPGESRVAHNIDWGRNVGSITKRLGYDSLTTMTDIDSLVALYGAYYSDGTQQLIIVSDSADVGYGSVYASPKGEARFPEETNKWVFNMTGSVEDNYEYLDSFYINSVWYEVSYTTPPVAATIGDIIFGIATAINSGDTTGIYLTAQGYGFYPYPWVVTEDTEESGIQARGDTSMTLDTIPVTRTKIWDYFSVLNKPSFAMYGDVVFGVNGSHKGIAYNGDVARSWPLNAPGEPTIVPLTTAGPPDGEYRYTFTYLRGLEAGDSSYGTAGTVTMPVRVTNGQILLRDFQWVGADTINASPDSVGVVIYRTRANPGRLEQRDSAFLIDTVWGTSASNLATLNLIDSTGDDDLGAGISIWVDDYIGRDTSNGYDHRYGAPTYLDCDSVLAYTKSGTNTDSAYNAGIYHGIPDQVDTLGVQYIVTFMDTVLGVESNASPPLSIQQAHDAVKAWSQRIGLPTPVEGDTGIVRNLYRAHILQITRDSVFNVMDSIREARTGPNIVFYKSGPGTDNAGLPLGWEWRLAVDTVMVSTFYLVAQVSADSTAYTDSTRWDSLQLQPIFAQSTPPPFMSQIFSYNGRMFGIAGSRLYMSRLDSAAAWGALDYIALGEGDGDQNMAAYPSRAGITVLKNRSRYTVQQIDAAPGWGEEHINGFIGCIASRSVVHSPMGVYYLSSEGIRRTTDGITLDRTYEDVLVSAPLKNFTDLPITTLVNTEGFYFDQKAMFCIGDTTYVYDERAGAWSTWNMTFAGATLYGTEDELNFLPGDSMYFIRAGDSLLYRYGAGSQTDKGSQIRMRWRSGPIGLDNNLALTSINSVTLITNGDDATDQIYGYIYDESDVEIDVSPTIHNYVIFDSLTVRYRAMGMLPHFGLYHSFHMTNGVQLVNSDAVVDGIVIRYSVGGVPLIE